jgi:hypothetical protein
VASSPSSSPAAASNTAPEQAVATIAPLANCFWIQPISSSNFSSREALGEIASSGMHTTS